VISVCIDPGPEQSAYVVWDAEAHDFYMNGANVEKHAIVSTEGMIGRLRTLVRNGIEVVAIEMIQSFGMPVGRSTFQTVLNIGRFVQAVYEVNPTADVRLYGRPSIKGQLGGKNDAEIRASLRLRYGEARKGEKLEGVVKDQWSALALATAIDEKPSLKVW
jgi:hypothetical protein